jgi:ligand-binding SRPBCC domain-containing protein
MIKFSSYSGIYSLETEQVLPITLKEAWEFFSLPSNLQEITPEDLSFNITSADSGKMFAGQLVTYRIGIFPLIKSNWVTEITHVEPMTYFIDEQRFGPYKMWHHRHLFEEKNGALHMCDKVEFKLPFGFIGRMFYPILIKPRLKKIFNYRREKLEVLFNS